MIWTNPLKLPEVKCLPTLKMWVCSIKPGSCYGDSRQCLTSSAVLEILLDRVYSSKADINCVGIQPQRHRKPHSRWVQIKLLGATRRIALT